METTRRPRATWHRWTLAWSTVLLGAVAWVALGPGAAGWVLVLGGLLAATSPPARRAARRLRLRAEPAHHAVGQWSDGDLVRAWRRSDDELRACAGRTAGRTLTVVMWRATLLDELDRRDLSPPAHL